MARPGKHTFPTMAAIRRRTAREIKASAQAAIALKKQTACEMKEGARQAKITGKKLEDRIKKLTAERAAAHADYLPRGPVPDDTPDVSPPQTSGSSALPADWTIPAPRQVRLAAAIADAYYRPDDPKAVTVLRIKKALTIMEHIAKLLDDLYPV